MLTQEAKEYREELAQALVDARCPDYANALYAFKSIILLDENNPRVGAVAGSSLIINKGLTMEEACFVARHEIIHIRYMHHLRMKERDPQLWNIACDIEISNTYDPEDDVLMEASDRLRGGLNINFKPFAEFRGMPAEDVYDILLQREQEQMQNAAGQGNPEQNDSQGTAGMSGQSGESGDQDDGSGEQPSVGKLREDIKDKEDLKDKITKSIYKKIIKALDKGAAGEKPGAQEEKPKKRVGKGKRKESNSRPEPQPEPEQQEQEPEEEQPAAPEQQEAPEDQNNKFGDAEDFDMGGNGVGTGHAETGKEKPEPTRVKLLRSLKGVFGRQKYYERKRTYAKPNRRLMTPPGMMTTPMSVSSRNGIIKKGVARKTKECLTLGVYCDVSGSMSRDKVSLALGACEEINKLRRCAVKTHYFDTVVKDEFFSGGGTDYNAVLEHAKEHGYKSIALITDNSSDAIPEGVYSFDNMWIIGVEHSYDDSKEAYSIGPQIVDGTVKVKNFDGFIVCTEDELNG